MMEVHRWNGARQSAMAPVKWSCTATRVRERMDFILNEIKKIKI
jgi:hypothetical protein